MVLNKGIWDPKPRVTSIKGTNLKSLTSKSIQLPNKTSILPQEGVGYVNAEASTVSFYKEALAASRVCFEGCDPANYML